MHASEFTVEFGDCDEAGIVHYPKYFYWFDCAFHRLLRARGLNQRELRRRFGAVTPIVDAGAKFRAPAAYDAVITAQTAVGDWQERRFKVSYRLDVAGRTIAEGHEVRAWALFQPDGGIRGGPVAPEFRALLES